jgi:DNA ligase-1
MKIKAFLLFFFVFSNANSANPPKIQLANLYHEGVNLDEYLVSEKLDGVRARWNGKNLISRQGNLFNPPKWFIENFPKEELDGELWVARGKFEEASSIVRKEIPHGVEWQKVHFMIFDLPKSSEVFALRYEHLKKIIHGANSKYLQLVEQFEVPNHATLMKLLDATVKNGGEGLMLHRKSSQYQAIRSDDILKLKSFEDTEAVVIAHIQGKGKLKGKMGAILVENDEKIRFKIGGGFSEEQRKNPPKIGSRITYKFFGKTKNNTPRFPSFMRVRSD